MCCSDPPPPPDLSGISDAQIEVAQMAQQSSADQLAWAKEQDAMNRETLNQVLDVQLPAMRDQFQNAREDRQRWETQFRPLEDAFVQEAMDYDTPERRGRERGRAIADVNSQFDAARRNSLQRLESYGVDPSQTRSAALDIGVRTQQAMAQAGAATQSDTRVENTGRALRSDAINLGRGALSGVAQSYGGAVGAGSAATSGVNQTTGTSSAAMSGANQGLSTALSGYAGAGNTINQGFQNQMQGWQAQSDQTAGMLAGVGNIAGMAMGLADGGQVDQNYPGAQQPLTDEGLVDTGIGDGSGIDDSVPAMVSDGEYVIPADVVRIKGEEFFDKLVERYHTPAAQQRKQGMS